MSEPVRQLKAPVELAALKSRLVRAERLEASIGAEGRMLDLVLDSIEERSKQISSHRGVLEDYNNQLGAVIDRMIGGSNQPPAGNGSGSPVEGEPASKINGDGQGDKV